MTATESYTIFQTTKLLLFNAVLIIVIDNYPICVAIIFNQNSSTRSSLTSLVIHILSTSNPALVNNSLPFSSSKIGELDKEDMLGYFALMLDNRIIIDFAKGESNLGVLNRSVVLGGLKDQIYLKSEKSYSKIKFIESWVVEDKISYESYINRFNTYAAEYKELLRNQCAFRGDELKTIYDLIK